MDGLIEGRIVHYVLPNGEHRPAIIVRVWRHRGPDDDTWIAPENGCSNLQVFTDGLNDAYPVSQEMGNTYVTSVTPYADNCPTWKTSVLYSEKAEPNTWHWIERA